MKVVDISKLENLEENSENTDINIEESDIFTEEFPFKCWGLFNTPKGFVGFFERADSTLDSLLVEF